MRCATAAMGTAARLTPPGCLGRNTKTNRCLAEGRRSFLERYARIESGGECERLAPLLSAFVDGEAGGAQSSSCAGICAGARRAGRRCGGCTRRRRPSSRSRGSPSRSTRPDAGGSRGPRTSACSPCACREAPRGAGRRPARRPAAAGSSSASRTTACSSGRRSWRTAPLASRRPEGSPSRGQWVPRSCG
jgi:hypothetical protein